MGAGGCPLLPWDAFVLYFWRNLAQNYRYTTIVCATDSGFRWKYGQWLHVGSGLFNIYKY